ncbi:MAG: AAA family ATPase [Candidatus Nanopelagicales bacterium]
MSHVLSQFDTLNLDSKPRPRDWLLTQPLGGVGFLPRGEVGMVTGGPGKSMSLLQLAVSVASGVPWLGAHGYPVPPSSVGKVFMASAVDDDDENHRRLWDIRAELALTDAQWNKVCENLCLMSRRAIDRLVESSYPKDGAVDLIRKKIGDMPLTAAIFDPLPSFGPADMETDNYSAMVLMDKFQRIALGRGRPSVVLAHPMNKSGRLGDGAGSTVAARGSSAISDCVRWQVSMGEVFSDRKPTGKRVMVHTKGNYGPLCPAVVYESRPSTGVLVACAAAQAPAV